jgi:hypothetical protein
MSRIDKMTAKKSGYDSDDRPSDGDKSDSDNGFIFVKNRVSEKTSNTC